MAGHAAGPHDDRRHVAHLRAHAGPGDVGQRLVWIALERGQSRIFKGIERVRRRAAKRIVRNESIPVGRLVVSDNLAQFQRELRWDRNAAGMLEVVRGDEGMPVSGEHAVDDVAGVKRANTGDNHRKTGSLALEAGIGDLAQAQPDGEGKPDQNQHNQQCHQRGERARYTLPIRQNCKAPVSKLLVYWSRVQRDEGNLLR